MSQNTVYVDGVFDLFHAGHIAFLRKARKVAGPGARLIAGVITDEDARWKRKPVIPHVQRVEVVRHCMLVDEVIPSPPLVLTDEFLDEHGITCVVHGDDSQQAEFFAAPRARGIMKYVPYERESPLAVSTSGIIAAIRGREE